MFTREKVDQAVGLLEKHNLDIWLTLCRETMHTKDPALSLIYTGDAVWLSAFIVGKNGENIAIVGNHDAEAIRQRGEFDTVIGYDEDFKKPFLNTLQKLDPDKIGINFSQDNPAADGLSYGLWLKLNNLLEGTPYQDSLVSAAPLIGELRGIKTPGEIDKICCSIACAEEIISRVGEVVETGMDEIEISLLFKKEMRKEQVIEAWSAEGCPAVDCGPESEVGHSLPSPENIFQPGQLLHIDFGVIKDNYASDLQRVWYLLKPDEEEPPAHVTKAFNTVREAIEKAAEVIQPGIEGYQVDKVARDTVVNAGYPEFKFALGHQVGQKAHDGGSLLGPKWPRYGETVKQPIKKGNVFTLELGVPTPAGYVGLEEIVMVSDSGCHFLSRPQREVWLLR